MIHVLIQAAVTLAAWFILMLVCTNLIGFLVRGFFTTLEMETIIAGDEFLAGEHRRDQRGLNIIASALIIVFVVALYYFWNVALVAAALMLMGARIPDLIWEIKRGRKLDGFEIKLQPRAYQLTNVVSWASIPVIWYALYRM